MSIDPSGIRKRIVTPSARLWGGAIGQTVHRPAADRTIAAGIVGRLRLWPAGPEYLGDGRAGDRARHLVERRTLAVVLAVRTGLGGRCDRPGRRIYRVECGGGAVPPPPACSPVTASGCGRRNASAKRASPKSIARPEPGRLSAAHSPAGRARRVRSRRRLGQRRRMAPIPVRRRRRARGHSAGLLGARMNVRDFAPEPCNFAVGICVFDSERWCSSYPDKHFAAVFGRETFRQSLAVLERASRQVGCHAGVDCPMPLACDDVDAWLLYRFSSARGPSHLGAGFRSKSDSAPAIVARPAIVPRSSDRGIFP